MSLGRHERILSIDGDTVQIQHPHHEGGRGAATYHISNVVDCKRSKRVHGSFKLLVYLDRELKRYDFECEEPSQICALCPSSNASID